jgi:hypothetical protein
LLGFTTLFPISKNHTPKHIRLGDVNGDGLDDLIVGADGSNPSGKSSAGKSYVVSGKANSSAIC